MKCVFNVRGGSIHDGEFFFGHTQLVVLRPASFRKCIFTKRDDEEAGGAKGSGWADLAAWLRG